MRIVSARKCEPTGGSAAKRKKKYCYMQDVIAINRKDGAKGHMSMDRVEPVQWQSRLGVLLEPSPTTAKEYCEDFATRFSVQSV